MTFRLSEPRLTGIFGGSFDPPHVGHLGIVTSFWNTIPQAEELLIIPNCVSPLKGGKHASGESILQMLDAQFSKIPKTKILDIELRKKGTSYTYETLLELRESYPDRNFLLLVGEDNYSEFQKWRNWENIFGLIRSLLVFRRVSEYIPKNPYLNSFEEKILFLNNPIIPAASTDLRNLLPAAVAKNRKPIALSRVVWDKILESKVYSGG
ncbi:nicotinate-nucleotide adenylyltransferase [Leptospira inadai serovar Lyme str. 10]|uniref:Probable nicotinate-nucleotide adenylyltransferase n=2 Tax=Leptospira inadai serovar Lyme TaxID=293084 RepID=V6HBX9_9LEPT|nr:nicotinate (nicotinamide) nucleotide adenylyltransferase [Leptospira inadai]EQA37017.1 nicotinate-nucleotide adenylyltransferase [Leptospira inadai serovar Lyme str. 10]PNV74556.1 nicotinate (nicotinamide) nucleotide adenylyltransferase [Leptospira inadai serovar Lyme]